jgi:hypothetical protein
LLVYTSGGSGKPIYLEKTGKRTEAMYCNG